MQSGPAMPTDEIPAEVPTEAPAKIKSALRSVVRQQRRALSPSQVHDDSARVRAHLIAWLQAAFARRDPIQLGVASYGAMPEELDLLPLEQALAERKLAMDWTYPRVEGPGVLSLRAASVDALVTGPYGIRQPSERCPIRHGADIDVVLVPGLAFDHAGGRLGFGGGYYDRLLDALRRETPDVQCIGIAHDVSWRSEALPWEPHDQRMDWICTPSRGMAKVA